MRAGLNRIKPYGALAAAALVMAAFPVLFPNPYHLNVANIIGLNTIIVVGLSLLIGYAGQISLGHAAFYGLGAYVSGVLTVNYGVPPWPGLFLALAFTGLAAMLIGIPTLKLHGHYLVMATLGFNIIVNIVMIQWDKMTGGPSGFPGIPNLTMGPWTLNTDIKMYYLIWFCAFTAIVLALNLVHSRVGRGLRALHDSEVAAASLGVNTATYKVKVFVLSALFASLSGSLYAHYLTFVSPKTFDIFFSVELVTMVILGGMGSVWGVLFGTAFLTSLPNALHFFDEYKDILYGLILVLILMFLPEGAAVAVRRRWFSGGKTEEADAIEPEDADSRSESAFSPVRRPVSAADAAVTESAPILSVRDVSIRFGGLMALGGVSFDLPAGSVTALIGPNGAGKTTMINVISGNYRPQHGSVLFGGVELTHLRPYDMAAIGLTRTFQNIQMFVQMTVLESVMVGLHAKTTNEFARCMFHLPGFRRSEHEIEQKAWEALRFLGLERRGRWLASSLSYGEQKRVEIARALVSDPKLILLDEPVAGLNISETKQIARLIEDIRAQGVSVLLVEHDMNLVMGVSDKVIVLNYGRKIAEGRPADVQRDEQVLSAYLGGVA